MSAVHAVRSFTWSTIFRSADPYLPLTELLVRSFVGMFLPLFCVIDLETSNGLMPAAGEHMMLNSLLIVPGVEHAMLNIWVKLCLLVLRPRGSMVLRGSRIMSAPGII